MSAPNSKHAVFIAAGLALAPLFSFAQGAPMGAPVCTSEDTDCGVEGCKLPQLPYEEFIAAPPSDRGGNEIPSVADRPFDPESGPRILVKGFVVDGVTPNAEQGITQATVQAAADAAFQRETAGAPDARMTVGHMVRVADEVTVFYRNNGYIVAKAFLPVQTIGPDSIVHIQVVEGTISDVVVVNNKNYSVKTLRKPSMPLIGTRPQRDAVESALLYTQDYPGVRMFGTFKPGDQTGDTKLVLQVQQEDSFDFSVGADNYGNKFTGAYRFRGDMGWNNPLGLGDRFNLTLVQAVQPAKTTFGSASYRYPLGPRGGTASLSYSKNLFGVGGTLSLLKLEGTINSLEVGYDWKFRRKRFSNASAGAQLARKTSELTLRQTNTITDDSFTLLSLSIDGDRVDTEWKGVDQATFKLRQGLSGDFKSSVDETFTIGELRYARIQSLGDTQTGVLRTRLQYTSNTLSPLEQFALAGPDVVRAYPVGQALTDSGFYTGLEYRVQAPGFSRAAGPFGRTWGDLLSTIVFFDYAGGRDTATEVTTELSGAGVGIQFGIPSTFNLLLQGAQPISKQQSSDGTDFRLYAELSYKF